MTRRFALLHPSTVRLHRWLEAGADPVVGLHVEHCARCADRLEELDADGEAAPQLQRALSDALAPPADLGERVRRSVELRWKAEHELALLAGLFAVGVETAQLMFTADADQDRSERSTDDHEEDTP